jgi:hypothetical protein
MRESRGNRETNSAIVSSKGRDSPVSSWSKCLDSSAPIMAASVIAEFEVKATSREDITRGFCTSFVLSSFVDFVLAAIGLDWAHLGITGPSIGLRPNLAVC